MISVELKKAINNYLNSFYIVPAAGKNQDTVNQNVTKGTEKKTNSSTSVSLDELIKEAGDSFHEVLFSKIKDSGLSEVEIYKRADIDRKLFSKIRKNPAYHPRRNWR